MLYVAIDSTIPFTSDETNLAFVCDENFGSGIFIEMTAVIPSGIFIEMTAVIPSLASSPLIAILFFLLPRRVLYNNSLPWLKRP